MKKNINKISNKIKVLVIGDLMLDEYLHGNVERVSPEAPVPIVRLEKKIYSLGGAGNVSNNISSLGAKASLISVVGKDENSKRIDSLLKKKKIDKFFVLKSNKFKTIVKSRILSQGQQVLRLDNEDDIFFNTSQKKNIFKNLKNKIENFNCVIVSDYGKGVCDFELVKNIIELSNKLKIPVNELRDKSADELVDELGKLKKEAFNLRFQKATGQLENSARVRFVRRSGRNLVLVRSVN